MTYVPTERTLDEEIDDILNDLAKMDAERTGLCFRCVMDKTAPGFTKTETGCNFCDDFYTITKKCVHKDNTKHLEDLFNVVRTLGRGKPYDAIIGVSGGIDSSTTLCLAHTHGLRILMVHADNHWDKNVAINNIIALQICTGFGLYEKQVDLADFIDVQKAILKSGVINLEAVSDLIIQTTIYETAEKFGIPSVINGSNINSEALRCVEWGYKNDDKRNLRKIFKKFGTRKGAFKRLGLMNIYKKRRLMKKLFVINPLNYVNYNPFDSRAHLQTLMPEFQDYGEKHEESLITDFYQRLILVEKFGIVKRKVFYSNNVCAGHMTRQRALEKLEMPHYPTKKARREQLREVSAMFGLTIPKLESLIMDSPITPHETYGTDKVLRFLAAARFHGLDLP